jgi:hypothetical protein
MALPTTIISSATTTWSDHRNQSHGGAQRVTQYSDSSDNGTFYNLGDTHQYVGRLSAFTGQAGHKLLRVRFYLQRVGSPSGNVFVEVRPQVGSGSSADPDFNTLWGTSRAFPVASIPTTGKNEIVFSFSVPVTLPVSDTTAFAILLTISAQGDASNYVKVYRGLNGDFGGSRSYGSAVWNTETTSTLSTSQVVEISKSGARVVLLDKSANFIRAYKTDDNNGTSWSVEGSSGGLTSTANLKSANTQAGIHDLGTTYLEACSSGTSLGIQKRSESAGWTQDPATLINFSTFGTNVTGNAPIFGGRRVNGNAIVIAQGATETVMGSARRRIKLSFYNGTTWSSLFDVAGSANTPDATLPGTGVDYDLRWAGVDPNGDCHIIFSKSDTSTLQYRKFKSDNTFATINTLNGAVASATVNYPVGQPCFSYRSLNWFLSVPYVDNTSNTLKRARCNTTTTETSGNWALTEIVAASAETANSNPAVLVADNVQGGKEICLRVVPTTRGLRITDDGGNDVWKPETDWRGATQQVGGISALYTEDGIALVYLEESTTPDELRYDRL